MKTSLTHEAFLLGRDGILLDPTDDEICLAAAEAALGNWPVEGLDRGLCERIVAAYEKGEDARS
jgi:hypothetical protein